AEDQGNEDVTPATRRRDARPCPFAGHVLSIPLISAASSAEAGPRRNRVPQGTGTSFVRNSIADRPDLRPRSGLADSLESLELEAGDRDHRPRRSSDSR